MEKKNTLPAQPNLHNVRSASHKIYRQLDYANSLTFSQQHQQPKEDHDVYFYPKPIRNFKEKPQTKRSPKRNNNYESLHIQTSYTEYKKSLLKNYMNQDLRTPDQMNNSHFIKRKTHNFESKHEPEDNKIHLINNVNEFKKRIDGPLIQKRKFKGFTASTLKKQIKISTNKKLQIGVDSEVKKQENKKNQRYPSASNFNASSIIKKHKASNIKEIQKKMRSTMSKFCDYQQPNIKQYIRKCGFPEDSKVFIWNSQDNYIQRILKQWGWIQNESTSSPFFHLKWTYLPLPDEKVGENQMINHFKNSHEITSKSYLTKNLKNSQFVYGCTDGYYPKCFDIGNANECEEFIHEYEKNVMSILLKKVYNHCFENEFQKVKEVSNIYKIKFKKNIHASFSSSNSVFRNKKFRKIQFENYKQPNENFRVHINLIIQALKYWRNFRKNREQTLTQSEYHFLNFKRKEFEQCFTQIRHYTLKQNPFIPTQQLQNTKEFFATPSDFLIERIVKEYTFWSEYGEFKYNNAYGDNNIWIIKPSSTSRGNGIYLATDLNVILSSSKAIQSRIVQKYIEKPLIVKNKKYPILNNKKFDLRQWVLLKSIDPLEIYMFSHCYLRICADKYTLQNIVDMKKHLTNYSINKTKFKAKDDSVLSIEEFITILSKEKGVSWEETIRPKIIDIVIKSIKSCQQNLQDYGNNCFELLGYDILLDEEVCLLLSQLNPWLLQINMSPACDERTDWLTQYLNEMGTQLLQLVIPQINEQKKKKTNKYQWELIYEESYAFNRKRDPGTGLQVFGFKADIKQDIQKSDQQCLEYLQLSHYVRSAIKIQKFMKKYVPKYRLYKIEKFKKIKQISKYLYSLPYSGLYQRKRERFGTKIIQKYINSLQEHKKLKILQKKKKIGEVEKYSLTLSKIIDYQKLKKQQQCFKLFRDCGISLRVIGLHNFTKQMIIQTQKSKIVQRSCKKYIQYRREKKRKCEKYIKSIIQVSKYGRKLREHQGREKIEVIECYLLGINEESKVEERMKKAYLHRIQKCLRSIYPQRCLLQKKLKTFGYIVNRILRVSKKRQRGKQLKGIIKKWKQSNKMLKVKVIEAYMRGRLTLKG